jgi:membrane protease YdiL (CAAX protease family)
VITIISSVAGGTGVLLAGNVPWAVVLAPLNVRFATSVPWAVAPMLAYLWIYWKYVTGGVGAPGTAGWRREYARANSVSGSIWPIALLTGMVGFAALIAFVSVMARLVILPSSAPITTPTGMSSTSMFVLLAMGSVVAGVTEEVAFRGYMQTPLERRFGVAAAVFISGIVFGLLHFPNHPHHVLVMLPYYVAVSAVYGGITSATNSILPALLLHTAGDIWSLTRLWVTGAPEWQAMAPAQQIWATGVDRAFVAAALALIMLSTATVWLCLQTGKRAHLGSHERREREAAARVVDGDAAKDVVLHASRPKLWDEHR